MAMGDIVTLRDARDNKSYRIKKMPDNKCWMIDNLAYVGGGTNTYGDTVTVGTAGADGTLTEYTSGNGSSGTWTTTTGYTDRHFVSNSNANITLYDGTRCTTSSTGSGVMASVCGNQILYNFCAALGLDGATTPACTSSTPTNTGTGAGYASAGVIGKAGGIGGESKGNISAANQAGINSSTQGSICPAGWRLPAGRVGSSDNNTKNEWAILNGSLYNNTYTATPNTGSGAGYYGYWQPAGTSINASSTNLAGGAFQTVASGYFNPGNGLLSQSTDGYWWTSSLYSPTNAAVTLVGSSYVNPGTYYGYRYRGFAVRCTLP
jgi:uncharacterized protein (TIGR02145 family)